MPKVTPSLRRAWAIQRAQAMEEREFTQSGQSRTPESIAEMDEAIANWTELLNLPLGTKF